MTDPVSIVLEGAAGNAWRNLRERNPNLRDDQLILALVQLSTRVYQGVGFYDADLVVDDDVLDASDAEQARRELTAIDEILSGMSTDDARRDGWLRQREDVLQRLGSVPP